VAFDESDHVVFEQEEIVWLHHQSLIVSETAGGKRGSFVDCRIVSGGNDLAKFERHVFVCTNVREPGSARPSCTQDGIGKLHGIFKDKIKDAGLRNTVRANKAGCLDQCEHGSTVVVYPDSVWYGRPVERLVLAEECINTASCPHRAAVGAK
jgi:hypothetical protein